MPTFLPTPIVRVISFPFINPCYLPNTPWIPCQWNYFQDRMMKGCFPALRRAMASPPGNYRQTLHANPSERWAYSYIRSGCPIHENLLFISCGVRILSFLPLHQGLFPLLSSRLAYVHDYIIFDFISSHGFIPKHHHYFNTSLRA